MFVRSRVRTPLESLGMPACDCAGVGTSTVGGEESPRHAKCMMRASRSRYFNFRRFPAGDNETRHIAHVRFPHLCTPLATRCVLRTRTNAAGASDGEKTRRQFVCICAHTFFSLPQSSTDSSHIQDTHTRIFSRGVSYNSIPFFSFRECAIINICIGFFLYSGLRKDAHSHVLKARRIFSRFASQREHNDAIYLRLESNIKITFYFLYADHDPKCSRGL